MINIFHEIEEKHRRRLNSWCKDLRHRGIKAAMPNDGWVNREEMTLIFTYPYFNDGAFIGDKVALGSGVKDEIIVVLTSKVKSYFLDDKWNYKIVEKKHE